MHALSSHLSATFTRTSSNFGTSSSFADLSVFPSLICDFCPSDQEFAYSFLQIPPRDGHPCCSAIHFPLSGRVRDFHPLERAHGAQTKNRQPFYIAAYPPMEYLDSGITHAFLRSFLLYSQTNQLSLQGQYFII